MPNLSVGQMADAIMEDLKKYAEVAAADMKTAVEDSAKLVKQRINSSAPVRTGKYAKSWKTKVIKESANALVITVHSPTRYMLAHLLENGHAKRGGGRVSGSPHIKPAEKAGIEKLEQDLERALKG